MSSKERVATIHREAQTLRRKHGLKTKQIVWSGRIVERTEIHPTSKALASNGETARFGGGCAIFTRNYGAEKGMLMVSEYKILDGKTKETMKLGYGYSVCRSHDSKRSSALFDVHPLEIRLQGGIWLINKILLA